jgi:hypothetical protein
MKRFLNRILAFVLVIVAASPAMAVIKVLLPLQKVMNDSSEILVTKVEKVDSDRPSFVLVVEKSLKGKSDLTRIPINLKGDAESEKEKQTPEMLKRLAPGLPVVTFLQKQPDGGYMMLAYTNGTWFQVLGQGDGKDLRWAYTHCETYLRRTFKGTTAELEQAVSDALVKRKRPPAPDPKEPAGLGPVVEAE